MRDKVNQLLQTIAFAACAADSVCARGQAVSLNASHMERIGTVDERFQSYNVEMLEVTGGKFWKPYSALAKQSKAAST